MIVEAGTWHGQRIEASERDLAALRIAPGSPQHRYLTALLTAAYWRGVNSESAKMAARLTDIYLGKA